MTRQRVTITWEGEPVWFGLRRSRTSVRAAPRARARTRRRRATRAPGCREDVWRVTISRLYDSNVTLEPPRARLHPPPTPPRRGRWRFTRSHGGGGGSLAKLCILKYVSTSTLGERDAPAPDSTTAFSRLSTVRHQTAGRSSSLSQMVSSRDGRVVSRRAHTFGFVARSSVAARHRWVRRATSGSTAVAATDGFRRARTSRPPSRASTRTCVAKRTARRPYLVVMMMVTLMTMSSVARRTFLQGRVDDRRLASRNEIHAARARGLQQAQRYDEVTTPAVRERAKSASYSMDDAMSLDSDG